MENNDKTKQAYAAWAKLDKACRHSSEPGGVRDRLLAAERKAWARFKALKGD